MSEQRFRPIELLMIEDNPADVGLAVAAMEDAHVRNRMAVAADGVEGLAYLRREGPYAGAPRPDLVLLDLNLPKKSGLEVLEEVKTDPDLRRIPVVVLTTSRAEQDILKSYNLHANAYVIKPVDLEQFVQVVKSIEGFWLEVVKLADQ